jgi:hypothetical protein
MEIRINNILEVNLANDDVNSFIEIFGNLRQAINKQSKKVGFKKNGEVVIELSEGAIEFISAICETAGIIEENNEQETNIQE